MLLVVVVVVVGVCDGLSGRGQLDGVLEVAQLGRVHRGEHDAVRVDVAVEYALLVQVGERVAHAEQNERDALGPSGAARLHLVHDRVERADRHALEHQHHAVHVLGHAEAHEAEYARKVVDSSTHK